MAESTLSPASPFLFSSFYLDKNGLRPLGTPTFEEWLACGNFIREAEQSVQFWIGDWLLYGEKTFGKVPYEKAIQQTGLDYQTLRDYKWVAHRVPIALRKQDLGFHHHREVAGLPPETQALLLNQAVAKQWPLLKLKQEKFLLRAIAAPVASRSAHPGFLHGDCTRLLNTLPDHSLDLLLTDPPYGIDYESEHREVNPFAKMENDHLEETLSVLNIALSQIYPKLKDNRHVYIFTSWKTYPAILPIVEKYFRVHNLLFWIKNNWTSGDLDANYGQIHEGIVFAQKGTRLLNGGYDSDLLRFSRVSETGRAHPTEKPLPLLEYLIEKSSQPGERVCDPFAGVASTFVAAQHTKRQCICMELDKHWYEKGVARLSMSG